MTRLSLAFLIVLLLAKSSAIAQQDYYIDPTTLYEDYLIYSIKEELDSIRKENGLSQFQYSRSLAASAREQALYVSRIGQKKALPKPQDATRRIKEHGGKFTKAFEFTTNLLLHQPVNDFPLIHNFHYMNSTYRLSAKNLVESEAQNQKLLQTVLSGEMSNLGIGVSLDSVKWTLTVVQLFASGQPEGITLALPLLPDSLSVPFPEKLKRYTHGFRKAKAGSNLRKGQAWTGGVNGNKMVAGYLIADYKTAKKAFRRWHFRTGLAMERDALSSFDTEKAVHLNPSRLDRKNLYQKEIPSFIHGRRLMKMARAEYWSMVAKKHIKIFGVRTPFFKPPKIFILSANSLPPYDNLLVIRKGKLCDILASTPFPAAGYDPPPVIVPYQSLAGDFVEKERTIFIKDTISFRFYYKRGVIDPDPETLQSMMRSIPEGRLVKEIDLDSHASLEGNVGSNTLLYTERGQKIQALLSDNNLVTSDIQLKVVSNESWDMFYEQIKESKYADISQKQEGEIRDFINQHKNDTLIARWLDEQRYSNVSLVLNKPEKVSITTDTLVNRFNRIIKKTGKGPSEKVMTQLSRIQLSYYSRIKEEGNVTEWNRLMIPQEKVWLLLQFNEAMYRFYSGELSEKEFFDWMQSIGRGRQPRSATFSKVAFNNLAFAYNHWFVQGDLQDFTDTDWKEIPERNHTFYFTEIKPLRKPLPKDERPTDLIFLDLVPRLSSDLRQFGVTQGIQKQLRFFFLVRSINVYHEWSWLGFMPTIRKLLNELYNDHLINTKLTDEERIRWALYCNQFFEFGKSEALLAPLVNRTDPDHTGLMIWISVRAARDGIAKAKVDVMKARSILTREEWNTLVSSEIYLSKDILEDYRIRKQYQVDLKQR